MVLDPTAWVELDAFTEWAGSDSATELLALFAGPRTAAFNPDQQRCSAGTGETSGRFSNEGFTNCNPQTSQLSNDGLDQRQVKLDEALAGDISADRRKRLEEEVRLVKVERDRRADPNQPEGDPAAGDTVGDPDNPIEVNERAADPVAEVVEESSTVNVEYADEYDFYGSAGPSAMDRAIEAIGEINDPDGEIAEAIDYYTDIGYVDINGSLRGNGGSEGGRQAGELISEFLNSAAPAKSEYRVFRGLSGGSYGNLPNAEKLEDPASLVGKTFSDNGISSTTTDETIAVDFSDGGYVLDLTVPKGGPGYIVSLYGEAEVLLPPGVRYKVTEVIQVESENDNGFIHVKAEVLV